MGVKIKTKINKLPQIDHAIKNLNGKGVEVGVFDGEHAWLAGIHEYGCKIPITPKMRAWMHANGLHVNDSKKYITIPERAFLRDGYDNSKEHIARNAAMLIADIEDGKMTPDQLLDMIGQNLSDKIRVYAKRLRTPPDHPFTVSRKHSSNPLVDTGNLIDGITFRKV